MCAASPVAAEPTSAAEKVRVTYEATGACPSADDFLAQVRARVGTGWEAPPNELARTIEVRVTGGADRSVARIDFVDENGQPITRAVSAATCDEVVTGIALVTALAIESRIAEAVGRSEPAPAPSTAPVEPAPEEPKPAPAVSAPPAPASQSQRSMHRPGPSAPPPHYDIGVGGLVELGALPNPAIGPRGFFGIGWSHGPDFRLGADLFTEGSVDTIVNGREYVSSYRLIVGRASVCPLAFGGTWRLLPCGGIEIGQLHAAGSDRSSPALGLDVTGTEIDELWFAAFLGLRGDVAFDAFFAELDASFAFPNAAGKDFVFTAQTNARRAINDSVHTVWPVIPSAALTIGVRFE